MKENTILDVLEFDPSSGSLKYKGIRYLLIRPETLTGFQKAAEAVSGNTSGDFLYQGGFQGGYLSSKKYAEVFGFSDRETIEFMMTMGKEIGWGVFELKHYDLPGKQLKITVRNSVFAEAYGPSKLGVCHLIRGVMAGMASILFNAQCRAAETTCISKGDEYCTFIVNGEK